MPSTDDVPGQVRLTPDGVEGFRLDSPGTDFVPQIYGSDSKPATADELPGGCVPAFEYEAGGTWDTRVWIVDDVVSSVQVVRRNTNLTTPAGLSTWLGPTLGSPIAAASELPGARTRIEQPAGAPGPEVTVVVVPVDDVEVVFSDVVFDVEVVPEEARRRITTIEVRHPRARPCSEQALAAFTQMTSDETAADVVIGLDGLEGVPIGSDVAVIEDFPGVQPLEGWFDGCEAFMVEAGNGSIRVAGVDGVVAAVSVWGDVSDDTYGDLPFRLGMTAEDVAAAVPAGVEPPRKADVEALEVALDDRTVRMELTSPVHWVEDVDVPVTFGEPAVHTVSVRDAAVAYADITC